MADLNRKQYSKLLALERKEMLVHFMRSIALYSIYKILFVYFLFYNIPFNIFLALFHCSFRDTMLSSQNQKEISDTWVKYIYLLLEVTLAKCGQEGVLFHNEDEFSQTLILRKVRFRSRESVYVSLCARMCLCYCIYLR